MLIPNHPHDERLSALASGDTEATADAALVEHVSTCTRCTDAVAELSTLRATLAELPDLRPHRPLQLLPPVTDAPPSRADQIGGWARRFFAPVLAAGAAVAMVGLVGTASPVFDNLAAGGAGQAEATDDRLMVENPADAPAGAEEFAAPSTGNVTGMGGGSGDSAETEDGGTSPLRATDDALGERDASADDRDLVSQEPGDASPWPIVLASGLAIMVAAAFLRFFLVPRAG